MLLNKDRKITFFIKTLAIHLAGESTFVQKKMKYSVYHEMVGVRRGWEVYHIKDNLSSLKRINSLVRDSYTQGGNFFFGSTTPAYQGFCEIAAKEFNLEPHKGVWEKVRPYLPYHFEEHWVYGSITNRVRKYDCSVGFVPDPNQNYNNNIIIRELKIRYIPVVALSSGTKPYADIDYPLLGNEYFMTHVVFYLNYISSLVRMHLSLLNMNTFRLDRNLTPQDTPLNDYIVKNEKKQKKNNII